MKRRNILALFSAVKNPVLQTTLSHFGRRFAMSLASRIANCLIRRGGEFLQFSQANGKSQNGSQERAKSGFFKRLNS
jgi:hypothetical protein